MARTRRAIAVSVAGIVVLLAVATSIAVLPREGVERRWMTASCTDRRSACQGDSVRLVGEDGARFDSALVQTIDGIALVRETVAPGEAATFRLALPTSRSFDDRAQYEVQVIDRRSLFGLSRSKTDEGGKDRVPAPG